MQQAYAIDVRHLYIENYQVEGLTVKQFERFTAVVRRGDFMPPEAY